MISNLFPLKATGIFSLVKSWTRQRTSHIKTIEARVTKNIKEDPSIEECDVWNIEATLLEALPHEAVHITTDPIEIGVDQLEAARSDTTRTAVTIRTQRKSRLTPGEVIHLCFE
jgi:hypothetical protein